MGTVVLVALGVVFWPLIFDSPDLHDPIVLQPMPEKPVIDQTPHRAPESFESVVREALPQAPVTDPEVQQAADESTRTDTGASDLRSLRDAEEISASAELSVRADWWMSRDCRCFGCSRLPPWDRVSERMS